ncbi:MAG: hypothetical protein AB7O67_07665 [Vicinamibacterales bacterium]
MTVRRMAVCVVAAMVVSVAAASAQTMEYKVLATSKTSTMEKELGEAAAAGYRFADVMGGETAMGGKEVVVLMEKNPANEATYEYRLLATSKTSTMEKELQQAADAGFEYVGQTVFESLFGGKEVVAILERNPSAPRVDYTYKLVATSRTSTLEKEMQQIGEQGYEALGMTVGQTAMGGNEMVVITRRRR